MKIVIYSNSPWSATGYGIQTWHLCKSLSELGHIPVVVSNWGQDGAVANWEGIRVYPRGYDRPWGEDILVYAFAAEQPDLIITLCNEWVLNPDLWAHLLSQMPDCKLVSWTPCERLGLPTGVRDWFKRSSALPLPMSRFGSDQLTEAGLEPLPVLPHCVDLGVFKPGPADRERAGFAGFTALSVGMNRGVDFTRKGHPSMFLAWRSFLDSHTGDAMLYCHTDRNPQHGADLGVLAKRCGLNDSDVTYAPPPSQYFSDAPDVLANLYRSADVLLMPSMGEGFGVPAVEAQACGLPVIMSDFTAQTELCYGGWLVDGVRVWDPRQEGWLFVADHRQITKRLTEAAGATSKQTNRLKAKAVAGSLRYGRERIRDNQLAQTISALRG